MFRVYHLTFAQKCGYFFSAITPSPPPGRSARKLTQTRGQLVSSPDLNVLPGLGTRLEQLHDYIRVWMQLKSYHHYNYILHSVLKRYIL